MTEIEITPSAQGRQMAPIDDQLAVLMSGVDYGDAELKRQMERELRNLLALDRPLRVYLGIDPTATSLTLGHTVPLRKLRQFQEFGHHAIFLIGDYTALIGDPSDKNKLRPMLTPADIKANEASYFEQAARILDQSKTELRHNSEWLSKLDFPAIISLMSKFTAAEMLRRDNFRQRWENGDAVYLHEFLYALMQGYDAYALECDVQVGGTEQLFNLMAGRKIQEDAGQRPHVPVTMPILVGLDGKERMSKSKGNHIGVNDSPSEQYGKAMSPCRPPASAPARPHGHEETPRSHHRHRVLWRSRRRRSRNRLRTNGSAQGNAPGHPLIPDRRHCLACRRPRRLWCSTLEARSSPALRATRRHPRWRTP